MKQIKKAKFPFSKLEDFLLFCLTMDIHIICVVTLSDGLFGLDTIVYMNIDDKGISKELKLEKLKEKFGKNLI